MIIIIQFRYLQTTIHLPGIQRYSATEARNQFTSIREQWYERAWIFFFFSSDDYKLLMIARSTLNLVIRFRTTVLNANSILIPFSLNYFQLICSSQDGPCH